MMTRSADDEKASFEWSSDIQLEIPEIDIVSFALDKAFDYDDDKAVYIDAKNPARYVSAKRARDTICKLIKGWKVAGLKQGDCVTIVSSNDIVFPLIWLGVIGAGGVVAGANPALTVPELQHHLTVTATKVVVAQQSHQDNVLAAAAQVAVDDECIFVFDEKAIVWEPSSDGQSTSSVTLNRGRDFNILLSQGQQPWDRHGNALQPALHATTSGTTGLPKAAVLPHCYVVSQALMLEDQYRDTAEEVRQLICLPVFHTFASNLALVLPLRLGIATYFMPRFFQDEFLDTVAKYAITDVPVVPPIIAGLTQIPDLTSLKLQTLRRVICAGSKMTPEVQRIFQSYMHKDCRVLQCWGATEAGWLTLTPDTELDRSGSVGRLLANTKLKIVAEDGIVITEDGRQGEALVKSPSTMLGYRNNPAANEMAFDSNGFYHTGDRVSYQDGKVFITGRMKDIMKVKGWQVSPEELEEKLIAHPSVLDCAVISITVRDSTGLEQTKPQAYIVTTDPNLGEDDINTFMQGQVVSYKQLTGGVIFVQKIPRNPAGKIIRRVLMGAPPLLRGGSTGPC